MLFSRRCGSERDIFEIALDGTSLLYLYNQFQGLRPSGLHLSGLPLSHQHSYPTLSSALNIFSDGVFLLLKTVFLSYKDILREYDTVARADNYFAEYHMLFSRRRGNERDIFEIALDRTSLFRCMMI
jgi:hypothetical protein